MKRYILLLLSLFILSCEMPTEEKGSVFLISCSLDYENTTVSSLECTNEDQMAVIEQFSFLSSLQDKAFFSYSLTQDGNNIYERTMTNPIFGDSVDRKVYFDLSNFKNRLKKIFDKVSLISNPEDLIIFYYAGHGVNGYSSNDMDIRYLNGALVMGNIEFPDIGDWKKLDSNMKYLYPLDELRIDISSIPGKKLIILDSCYSGEIIKDELEEGDIQTLLKRLVKPSRVYFDGIWELSGSRYDEESFEELFDDDVYHGRFTSALLTELGYQYGDTWEGPGEPKNGKITVYSLYEGVTQRINDRDQHPDTSISFIDLVIFNHQGIYRT